METLKAIIDRNDGNATLNFEFTDQTLEIEITEDKPNEVKSVFNKLLEQLKNRLFEFTLADTKEDLYFHICKEYISQLNTELKSTYRELEDNELLNIK